MPLGRCVARVANTPMEMLPPRRGGRTLSRGLSSRAWWNRNSNQTWLTCSSPATASPLLKGGTNSSTPRAAGASCGWRGMANFSLKQERTKPTGATL
ncbi:hypothetical protein D3C77_543340 [compost metagenome]